MKWALENFNKISGTHAKYLIHSLFKDFEFWVPENSETSINFSTFYKKTIYIHIPVYCIDFIFL